MKRVLFGGASGAGGKNGLGLKSNSQIKLSLRKSMIHMVLVQTFLAI